MASVLVCVRSGRSLENERHAERGENHAGVESASSGGHMPLSRRTGPDVCGEDREISYE